MTLIALPHPSTGRRCYVLGCRLHHGLVGLALAMAGAVLMVHDRGDWPWLTD
jgi:hypothetical protein